MDIILQSIGRDGTKDISFTVPRESAAAAKETLDAAADILRPHSIEVADNVTKVSIVGAGMQSNPGVAAKMFEALYRGGHQHHDDLHLRNQDLGPDCP